MAEVVLLDAGPLGMVSHPRPTERALQQVLASLVVTQIGVVVRGRSRLRTQGGLPTRHRSGGELAAHDALLGGTDRTRCAEGLELELDGDPVVPGRRNHGQGR